MQLRAAGFCFRLARSSGRCRSSVHARAPRGRTSSRRPGHRGGDGRRPTHSRSGGNGAVSLIILAECSPGIRSSPRAISATQSRTRYGPQPSAYHDRPMCLAIEFHGLARIGFTAAVVGIAGSRTQFRSHPIPETQKQRAQKDGEDPNTDYDWISHADIPARSVSQTPASSHAATLQNDNPHTSAHVSMVNTAGLRRTKVTRGRIRRRSRFPIAIPPCSFGPPCCRGPGRN